MKRNHLVTSALALSLLVMPAFGAITAPNGTQVSRDTLEREVRNHLSKLGNLTVFDNLSYKVDEDGLVTLSGQVTRPVLKLSAENVVRDIPGVSGLQDNIEVLPLSYNDNSIRMQAYNAIYGTPNLSRYSLMARLPIRIIVKNGNITLEGVVNNELDRQLAFNQVQSLPNVFHVTNNLKLDSEVGAVTSRS